MTDHEIISLLDTNTDRAYRQIIDQYGNLVYAIVLNKIRNISSREDLLSVDMSNCLYYS